MKRSFQAEGSPNKQTLSVRPRVRVNYNSTVGHIRRVYTSSPVLYRLFPFNLTCVACSTSTLRGRTPAMAVIDNYHYLNNLRAFKLISRKDYFYTRNMYSQSVGPVFNSMGKKCVHPRESNPIHPALEEAPPTTQTRRPFVGKND